jgi:type I restriction enzyme S subunit
MSNKAEKRGLIPKLRFPEFKDAGVWESKPLAKVCNVLQGYGFPEALQGKSNGKYPFCKVSDISRAVAENGGLLAEATNYVGDDELLKLRAKLIPKGATVFAKIGEALRLNRRAYVQKECLIDNNATGLKAIDGVAVDYFAYLLSQLIDLNEHYGGAVPSVNKSTLEEIEVVVPRPDEQKRIADCLASLDERITLEAQKLDTLKTHKKGLMQQLFPAEGETLPKLRFPEFRDAEEWEEKTLGQVAKYENGKAHEQDIAESGDFVVVNSKFISTEGEVRKFTNTAFCIAEKEDILMVLSDVPNGRAIAKCFLVDTNHLYTVNQRICKLTPYKAVSILLFYALNRNSYFLAFDDGVKQTNLKIDDVLDCPILLPNSLKEQQKIADCLASLDDLITAQTQKLAALKTHKKGLMQQLFPVVGSMKQHLVEMEIGEQ